MNTERQSLFTDREIANLIGMSSGWIRLQRHLRKHGRPHVLTIDPILVGAKPRYLPDDVMRWFEALKTPEPTVQ